MRRGFRAKFAGLWRSRTHWAGLILGSLVAVQPMLSAWLKYKLDAADYALAGLVVAAAISALRWVTDEPLEYKGK